MAVVSSEQIAAKRSLGEFITLLRLQGEVKKLSELAPQCGMTENELHKLEGGRGKFDKDGIERILTQVRANASAVKKVEAYLEIIHPQAPKNKSAVVVESTLLVPAFAG